MTSLSYEQLHALLHPVAQTQLLDHWPKLSEVEQAALAQQIAAIDFALVDQLREQFLEADAEVAIDWRAEALRAEAPPAIRPQRPNQPFSPADARAAGEQALRAGRVGAILVAGGQATRLGYDQPKGMFPIGPVSEATLFQILFEKLMATRERYHVAMPLYLMTSPATHQPTLDYLASVNRFGLPTEDLHVFCQGTMPAVCCESGKVLLGSHGQVALSPDGHGGTLDALARAQLFADMEARGIDQLYYFQVDNPLVQFCDPEFLGYHLLSGSVASTKVIEKVTPDEKLGNVIKLGGRLAILEYSDLPNDLADRRDESGQPIFWAGNLAMHCFERNFLAGCADGPHELHFHAALKKVPCVSGDGAKVEPQKPNALKFEKFIFDVLPLAETAIVVETDRAAEYAAVKNATGDYSPSTVRAQMMDLHRKWLRAAGAQVADDVAVEITPLFALDAEQVQGKIPAGTVITQPTVF